MTTIADWIERPSPVPSLARIESVQEMFQQDPGLSALAVIGSDGRPIGLVARGVLLSAEGALTCEGPASDLMSRSPILPASTPASDALEVLLAGAMGEGLIVAGEDGGYLGLVTRASLLKALSAGRAAPPAPVEDRHSFVEMLAREIRTPMTGILAVAELLQRQPLTADAQAYVQTIADSSESLIRLLDDSLDLAMGETGRLEPRPQPVRLRELVDEIQADWQARKSAGMAVLVAYDGDPDLGVHADGGRIRQVFANLINTALKATRQGAVEASLKARIVGDGVHIEGRVRDAGPGLEPDQLARIFEPAPPSAERARGGWSGLGPALSRRIVEAMHGSIRAESNIGEGVTVTFDLLAPQLMDEPQATEKPHVSRGGALHVLVVDDNATNRMVAEGLCEMFDCTSETAEDGLEAVEAARSGRFDLILMDIKMPRMDGMEATRAIRALGGPIGQTPIIALTANADPEDAKAYIACGMCSVVEKPIKPERLLAAMNAALEGKSPDAAVRAA